MEIAKLFISKTWIYPFFISERSDYKTKVCKIVHGGITRGGKRRSQIESQLAQAFKNARIRAARKGEGCDRNKNQQKHEKKTHFADA